MWPGGADPPRPPRWHCRDRFYFVTSGIGSELSPQGGRRASTPATNQQQDAVPVLEESLLRNRSFPQPNGIGRGGVSNPLLTTKATKDVAKAGT